LLKGFAIPERMSGQLAMVRDEQFIIEHR